jgi:hypothetical protein
MDHTKALSWHRSSYSGGSATSENCIEVAVTHTRMVGIRDSKNTDGPILTFTADDWAEFIRGIRAGKHG